MVKKMPGRVCFVDSVCWIALLNRNESIHQQVDTVYKQLLMKGYHLVTTTAVLNETANSLCAPNFRNAVSSFYHRIQTSGLISIEFVDEMLWEDGWHLYEKHSDKEWSLTDW